MVSSHSPTTEFLKLKDKQKEQEMACADPEGKSSWPELVGVKGKVAEATIERENPLVDAIIVVEGQSVITTDVRCDRVWVWVNKRGIVTRTPNIG